MTPGKSRKQAATKKAAPRARRSGASHDDPGGGSDVQPAGEVVAAHGPAGTALISGVTFTDRPVQYSERDGMAYVEGDIIVGRVSELQQVAESRRSSARDATRGLHRGVEAGTVVPGVDRPPEEPLPDRAVIIPGGQFRWPAGRVPFVVDASLTAAASAALTSAMTHWHDNTRLAFVASNGSGDRLNCRDANECSSWVGRRGGAQDVNLSSLCGFGATVHELGHAVGLWHEQSREDRDSFVTINWANIQAGQSHNFDQHITDGDDVGAYDYGSIMHYGRTAFGIVDPATGRAAETITPTQALPPGVIVGQRGGLSVGDRAAVAQMYPSVYPNPANTWVGRFEGGTAQQILYYSPARHVWYLGRATASGALTFTLVGDTTGFGDLDDGRPFWVGDFTGNGTTDVLFYYPGDDNWWLGSMVGGALTWSFVGNTAGFGHGINDGRPFWVGDFTGNGTTDVLFYYPGDDNWWLGSMGDVPSENNECAGLRLQIAEHRARIRELQAAKAQLNPRDPADRLEILELGRLITAERQAITAAQSRMTQLSCPITPNPGGKQLTWSLLGNTAGFGHGINDGRPFWIGDFTGDGAADVVFHYRGDLNWWLGKASSGALSWVLSGTW
jgi:hypothetical protein